MVLLQTVAMGGMKAKKEGWRKEGRDGEGYDGVKDGGKRLNKAKKR